MAPLHLYTPCHTSLLAGHQKIPACAGLTPLTSQLFMQAYFFAFITVASLQFLALIAPGPDFALVTRNALLYPRRESIYTALGIAFGLSIHISYCIFGMALVTAHALALFNILKYLGAVYLIYIGVKSWRSSIASFENGALNNARVLPAITRWQAWRQGFLCNLLNPKASLFFLGLFAVVIKPSTPWWQQLSYALWMIAVTFAWFSWLVCLITRPGIQHIVHRIQPVAVKVLGALLILMGTGLLFISAIHYAPH